MNNSFSTTLKIFQQSNLSYTIGAESLVGFVEGDLFKYTHNLRIYLFPTSILQIVFLAFKLLKTGVVFKPKFNQGRLFYKLRYKPSPLRKETTFVIVMPLKSTEAGFTTFLGGHDTFFSNEDLNQSSLHEIEQNGLSVVVPENHINFEQKYRSELMSGFYLKHEVQFDSESEKKAVRFMHQNVSVMNEAGIDFWMEGGTLLGALRDQKLIPWEQLKLLA